MEKQRQLGFPKFLSALITNLVLTIGVGSFSMPTNESSKREEYETASPDYIALAEKYMGYLSDFEFNSLAPILTEEVEYELTDGEFTMKKSTSGITSRTFHKADYLPINAHIKPRGNEPVGVKVPADLLSK